MPSQEMIDKHGKRLAYYIYHKKKGTLKSQKGNKVKGDVKIGKGKYSTIKMQGHVKLGEPKVSTLKLGNPQVEIMRKMKNSAKMRYKRHRSRSRSKSSY